MLAYDMLRNYLEKIIFHNLDIMFTKGQTEKRKIMIVMEWIRNFEPLSRHI